MAAARSGRLPSEGGNCMGIGRYVCDLRLPEAAGMLLIATGLAVIDGRPFMLARNGGISAG